MKEIRGNIKDKLGLVDYYSCYPAYATRLGNCRQLYVGISAVRGNVEFNLKKNYEKHKK